MAFIPIDAKADIQGNKKGRLTPAQHAQLNAWVLANKTGILDCLDRCTVQNTVIAINPSETEATVVFNKGYLVICGRLVECEQGTSVTIPFPLSGSINGKIVARYDLSAVGEDEFKVIAKTTPLDTEDLNINPITGKYDFVLYDYTANRNDNTVTLTRETNYKYIESNYKYIESIEERLTNLGFKQGNIVSSDGITAYDAVSKVGYYAIIKLERLELEFSDLGKMVYLFSLPTDFIPKTTQVLEDSTNYYDSETCFMKSIVYSNSETNENYRGKLLVEVSGRGSTSYTRIFYTVKMYGYSLI